MGCNKIKGQTEANFFLKKDPLTIDKIITYTTNLYQKQK